MKTHLPVKLLSAFVLSLLLFTSCKKSKFVSTGKLVLNFKNNIPSCYTLYTEEGYLSTAYLPIVSFPGVNAGGIKVTQNENTLTFEGLNYGTYVIDMCSFGKKVVQVAAGETKGYNF